MLLEVARSSKSFIDIFEILGSLTIQLQDLPQSINHEKTISCKGSLLPSLSQQLHTQSKFDVNLSEWIAQNANSLALHRKLFLSGAMLPATI